MVTVQLPGTTGSETQTSMNTSTINNNTSLAQEFQKHLSHALRKNGVLYQVKYIKQASQRKCTGREYHVQDNANVLKKGANISCDEK